jgi:hypothetical protein
MDPCLPSLAALNGRITPSLSSFILSGRLREVMLTTHGPSAASSSGAAGHTSQGRHAMESARTRVGSFSGSVCLILATTIAVNGCAAAVTGVGESELAQRRNHPEVVAVHYQPPPRFLVAQPRSVGRAMALGTALAPFALLLGPLAHIVAPPMANALQAEIERTEAEAAGEQLTTEIPLEDPVVRVKDLLISGLSAESGIGRIRPAATAMDSDDLKSLKQALGSVTVLDVRTTSWGLRPYVIDPKTFLAHYGVKTRLIRLDQEKVLWRAEIFCGFAGDRWFGAPTLEDLSADGGALLKTTMAKAAENCVAPLLARFRGEAPTPPVPNPDEPKTVTIEPATLEQADASLFGASGLVEGSRRFKAKFQGLTLTAQDLPRIRTMMKDTTASPWRSEVQFRGTIDGVAFKAEMEKGSVGRSEFMLEGLRFDDKDQASAFLAPLQGRGVREVKLVGVAGGRPIKIILTPTSASPGSSPSPPDEAGPARGLVADSSPSPSNDTTARPAPAPAVAQPAGSPSTPIATAENATTSVESQLQRLDDLRTRGLISENEHATLRKRVIEKALTTPERPAGSLTAPTPSRRSAAPGELKWPPAGSSYVMSERKSGSYGSGRGQRTIRYRGEQHWQGRKAFAFSDGSVTTYVDAQRRMLARVKDSDGAPLESFEPYFIFADWPISVGKWWPNRYRYYDHMSGRRFEDVSYNGKVEAHEDVRTPAGSFKAFRIALGGASSHTVLWYSGDLGLVIKTQSERRSNHYLGRGVHETELVSYDFKP